MNDSMKVPYSVVKRMLDRVAEHYKKEQWRLEDCNLTFEFIIASCFPIAWQNINNAIHDAYTAGYIAAQEEFEEKAGANPKEG